MVFEGNRDLHIERARHYVAAQRLKTDVLSLKARWLRYNLPVQELLRLLLVQHGLDAAVLGTDALERQYVRVGTAAPTISILRVTNTTLLVSPRAKSFDLFGFNEPQHHVLKQQDEYQPMARRKAELAYRGKKSRLPQDHAEALAPRTGA